MTLHWSDAEDIALALIELHPEAEPLAVRFTQLHQWVCELPGFADDPAKSNEKTLERIQMAWYEEWQERK